MDKCKIVHFLLVSVCLVSSAVTDGCVDILTQEDLKNLIRSIIPDSHKKVKGEGGRIGVLGGCAEHAGPPYFTAMMSMRVGADIVFVLTSEVSAPTIKSYSPDLIVHPYLSPQHTVKIRQFLRNLDVVIIGPGSGREDGQIDLLLDIIQTCKRMRKALILDAGAIYALSINVDVLKNYPPPGAILTPNKRETAKLMMAVKSNRTTWYDYWGDNVSVLSKGYEDVAYTAVPGYNWSLSGGGSNKRTAGQGDMLAGALGTFYSWALKSNLCGNTANQSVPLAQSVAMYAAAKLTRACNAHAYEQYGRNMIGSDMLTKVHSAFNEVFQA